MRREWRQPYDPLLCASRWARFSDVVWRFHSSVSSVSNRARRFSERDKDELADIAGDDHHAARSIRVGPTAAGALLAMAEIIRPGRFWILIRIQHAGIHVALAARPQYAAAQRSRSVDFMADCCSAWRAGRGMERALG